MKRVPCGCTIKFNKFNFHLVVNEMLKNALIPDKKHARIDLKIPLTIFAINELSLKT